MTKRTTTTARAVFLGALLLSIGNGLQNASASPILGQKVYYEGGSIEVTVLACDASYTSALYLFSTSSPLLIALNSEVGKVVNISNLPSLGVAVGDELIFGILVANTGDKFVTGPASRNPDNFAHAKIDYAEGPTGDVALFAFEDLWGGGSNASQSGLEPDFNDANFRISGGIGIITPKIPEPASVILLIVGLVGVVGACHRKKDASQI
jgi:hypothetical protein